MAYDPIRDEMSIVKRVAQLKQQGTPMVAPGGYDPNLNTLRNTVGSVSSWITQGDPKGNLALPQFSQWEAPVRQAMQEAQSGTLEQQFSAGPRFTPPPTPAPTPTPVAPQPTAQIAQPQAPQQPQFQQGGTIVGIGAPQYGQTQQPAPPTSQAQTPAQWNFNQQAGKWEQIGQQQTAPTAPTAPAMPPAASFAPPAPPTPQTSPASSYEEELRRLQESYAGPTKIPEQIESEKRLNDYLAQLDAMEAQKRTEQARAGMEPVAMPFITGRQEAIERMASTRAGEIGAKAAPLQRQLAQMQTERESQRQAALDISKIRLERIQEQEKKALEKQKFEREQALKEKELGMKYQPETEKPVTLGEGEKLIDPKTGKVIASGAQKPVDHSAIYKEWQDAVNSGYKDGFIQYQIEDANRKARASGSSAIADLNLQLKLLQIQQAKQQLDLGTVTQGVTSGYAERVQQSNQIFNQLEKNITKYSPAGYAFQKALPNWSPGKDPNIQSQDQAERNFVNAVLRRESGAAISPTEFTNAQKQYFPQPGDSAQVLAQKKANRNLVEQNLIRSSGPAFSPVISNDPLGIR